MGRADSRTAFDPGWKQFAVAVTLASRTVPPNDEFSPNVIQKGLWDSPGQWKMQVVASSGRTIAGCRFKGTADADLVLDASRTQLADGGWHEVSCWRLQDSYGVTVDGDLTAVRGRLGMIRSGRAPTIGSKYADAGRYDQFRGRLDCAVYVQGAHPRRVVASRAPC